jgi:hypothetical protein
MLDVIGNVAHITWRAGIRLDPGRLGPVPLWAVIAEVLREALALGEEPG